MSKYERLNNDLFQVERIENKTMKSGALYDFTKKKNVIEYLKMAKSREMSARMRQGDNNGGDNEEIMMFQKLFDKNVETNIPALNLNTINTYMNGDREEVDIMQHVTVEEGI